MLEDRFKRTKAELLDEIEDIRRRNNTLHMEVYRIAFEADPERMREVVEGISANDQTITELMKEAADTPDLTAEQLADLLDDGT